MENSLKERESRRNDAFAGGFVRTQKQFYSQNLSRDAIIIAEG